MPQVLLPTPANRDGAAILTMVAPLAFPSDTFPRGAIWRHTRRSLLPRPPAEQPHRARCFGLHANSFADMPPKDTLPQRSLNPEETITLPTLFACRAS